MFNSVMSIGARAQQTFMFGSSLDLPPCTRAVLARGPPRSRREVKDTQMLSLNFSPPRPDPP